MPSQLLARVPGMAALALLLVSAPATASGFFDQGFVQTPLLDDLMATGQTKIPPGTIDVGQAAALGSGRGVSGHRVQVSGVGSVPVRPVRRDRAGFPSRPVRTPLRYS